MDIYANMNGQAGVTRPVTAGLALGVYLLGSLCAASAQDNLQFSDLEGIQNWRIGNAALVYIQDTTDQWYEAQMDAACMKYDTSEGVKFITEAGETAPEVSKVMVGRRICTVTSLTKIDGLPE